MTREVAAAKAKTSLQKLDAIVKVPNGLNLDKGLCAETGRVFTDKCIDRCIDEDLFKLDPVT